MTNFKPTQPLIAAVRVEANGPVPRATQVGAIEVDASSQWKHGQARHARTRTAVPSMRCLAGTSQEGNPAVEMT